MEQETYLPPLLDASDFSLESSAFVGHGGGLSSGGSRTKEGMDGWGDSGTAPLAGGYLKSSTAPPLRLGPIIWRGQARM